jgi:hypothetical protein
MFRASSETKIYDKRLLTLPRVFLNRYEDLLFYGKEVTEAACQCFGGKINRRGFRHIGESAKVSSTMIS